MKIRILKKDRAKKGYSGEPYLPELKVGDSWAEHTHVPLKCWMRIT